MKMFKSGYWQKLVIILFILLELALLLTAVYYLTTGALETGAAIWVLVFLWVLNLVLAIFIVNTGTNNEFRIAWLFALAAFPVIGALFYLLFAHKLRTRREVKTLTRYYNALKHDPTKPETMRRLDEINPYAADVARYIESASDNGVYQNTEVQYFPLGDVAFPVMVRELKKAQHYIFLEYFILAPGKMWDAILDVLKQKARDGLDVRVVYDDVGNLGMTPMGYDDKLRSFGIKTYVYSKIKPFLDVRMNNRDHRKILVIDGHTCFTGGINLSDEYINVRSKYGHWKDNAIMLKGKAVFSFTMLFLANWVTSFEPSSKIDYDYYRPETYIDEAGGFPVSDGFVQPYGSLPFSNEEVGEGVYVSIFAKATHYVYASTPYLILDERLKEMIRMAAMQGTDVRILTPGIPDKKMVYQLTRSNYGPLLKAGVKIYEYTPGFVHQKMFIADDLMATDGTVNMDYRSLYLHLECGTYLVASRAIGLMKQDFLDTIAVSHEVTLQEWQKWRHRKIIFWTILKLFAPLL
jgi:cardiolipin synthase